MLPSLPVVSPSEIMLGTPFQALESVFMPWVGLDCSSPFDQPLELEPINMAMPGPGPHQPDKPDTGFDQSCYHAGLEYLPDGPNRNSVAANGPKRNRANPNSVAIMEERKRRRMESNRKAARQSRQRKRIHLENLRVQLNRLKLEKQDLTSRLWLLLHHCRLVKGDNDRLAAECVILQGWLTEISRNLQFRQSQPFASAWPFNNFTSNINALETPSLNT
ncbi:hypothetical protein Nepgr_016700 [Nepenthes gracilis]|uniref:BZIP domain-containing protein n=1 Tax=Nepenthes gracilis TaxID=150966 RepID=A0AAD3SQ62_NEPGR|nr:hypothetical protein Nepgr_016700 [Nepenthes gracilis]